MVFRGHVCYIVLTEYFVLLVEKCNDFSAWPYARISLAAPLGQSVVTGVPAYLTPSLRWFYPLQILSRL